MGNTILNRAVVTRLTNNRNGNPRFQITYIDSTGYPAIYKKSVVSYTLNSGKYDTLELSNHDI